MITLPLLGDNLDSSPLERPFKSRVLTHLPHNVPSYPFDAEAVSMVGLCDASQINIKFHTEQHSENNII